MLRDGGLDDIEGLFELCVAEGDILPIDGFDFRLKNEGNIRQVFGRLGHFQLQCAVGGKGQFMRDGQLTCLDVFSRNL